MPSGSPITGRPAVDPSPRKASRRPDLSRERIAAVLVRAAPWLIALSVYIVAAVVATWPVAADPDDRVFGIPGDATGTITLLRYRNELGVGPLSNAVTPEENAPFGLSLPGVVSLPQVVVEGPMQLVAAITGNAVLAYNLAIIAGLALSALACFALCRHVTGNAWAAGVAGVAYGFNPWIMERAHGHVHFTWLWSLPLFALGLVLLRERGGRWPWALVAASLVLALYTNTYFALFALVIGIAFVLADMGAALIARSRAAIRAAALRAAGVAAIGAVAIAPQAIVAVTQAGRIDSLLAGTRSPLDIVVYGSHWYEWLVPSYRHPIFDEWAAPYRLARLHLSNAGETALYLGVVMLALAALGVAAAVVAARRRQPLAWAGAFGLGIVVIGVITSLPAEFDVAGLELRAPASFISDVVEPWRVYARLYAAVALGVALLAAIGMAWVFRRLPRIVVPAVATVLAGLVAFDLAIDSYSFPAAAPPVYEALADRPGDAPRVEYPLVPPANGAHLGYIFFTQSAERPLLNGGRSGTAPAGIDGRLVNPASPWTAPALAALGVRWAVVHTALAGDMAVSDGFRRIGDYGGDRLYEVTAPPAPALATPAEGFGAPEMALTGRFAQWLERTEGRVAIVNPGAEPVRMRVAFTVTSFYRPREVTVSQGGRTLWSGQVVFAPVTVSVPVTAPPGRSDLDISTDLPPDPIAEVLEIQDPRSVALRMSGITLVPAGGRPFRLG